MQNLVNKNTDEWLRPWDLTKFDNLFDRDDRFFAILIKGMLSWLSRNIVMYGEPINHFIFNTGSSYMYIENNGYEYSLKETSGEDQIYMKMPRCIVEIDNVSIPNDELSQPYVRGVYERIVDNEIVGMNAEMRRIPIDMNVKLRYVLSNFNESIILMQELIDKIIFTKYFSISYLGQLIQCAITFPNEQSISVNKIDMTSTETNQKMIELSVNISAYYPQINTNTEGRNDNIISRFSNNVCLHPKGLDKESSDDEVVKSE